MPRVTQDYVENFGKVPTSPWMSGEQAHRTSAVMTQASLRGDIPAPNGTTHPEPAIVTPSRSMNTVVFHSKSGGNSIVINDEGGNSPGYMLITHNSGSVVQIDADGTVFIKSTGDTHNNTDGLHYQRSEGDSNLSVGGEWNVMVEGGSGRVFIQGDLNIECENFNLTARGKSVINSAEGVEIKGARISMEAHADNVDLVGKNIKIGSSETVSILTKKSLFLTAEESMNIKSGEELKLQGLSIDARGETDIRVSALGGNLEQSASAEIIVGAGGELKMSGSDTRIYGGTTYIDDFVRMAQGGASATEPAEAVEADPGIFPAPAELPNPPPRRPATDSRNRIRSIVPRTGGISSSVLDDPE